MFQSRFMDSMNVWWNLYEKYLVYEILYMSNYESFMKLLWNVYEDTTVTDFMNKKSSSV